MAGTDCWGEEGNEEDVEAMPASFLAHERPQKSVLEMPVEGSPGLQGVASPE